MTPMKSANALHACPFPGCLTFPYETEADLAEHVASGKHVMEADLRNRRTHLAPSATMAAPVPSKPSPEQMALIRNLLAERAGMPSAEALRDGLNAVRADGVFTAAVASKAIDALLAMEVPVLPREPDGDYAPEAERMVPKATGTIDPTVLEGLPAGRYFLQETYVRVDRPDRGRWEGYIFVKRQPYGPDTDGVRFALLNPAAATAKVDEGFRGLLDALLADPKAAAVEYGHRTGSCCVCGRTLTDPESVAAGIGPVCASKF